MKSFVLLALLFTAAVAFGQTVNPSPALNGEELVSFDFPFAGVTDTEATAISPSGVIAGRYFTSDGRQHGFVLKSGEFTPIDVAGTDTYTDAAWINARGDISGNYVSGGKTHAYILSRSGEVTTINFPGALVTTGWGSAVLAMLLEPNSPITSLQPTVICSATVHSL